MHRGHRAGRDRARVAAHAAVHVGQQGQPEGLDGGDLLGDLIFYQLSKQELVYGPNRIEAQVNQEQQIARDLTPWNHQGSRVLRGEMNAAPVGESPVYVESIYIQAESACMPQLRKVVLAMGEDLVYEDTFELADLSRMPADDPAPAGGEAPAPEAQGPSQWLRRSPRGWRSRAGRPGSWGTHSLARARGPALKPGAGVQRGRPGPFQSAT